MKNLILNTLLGITLLYSLNIVAQQGNRGFDIAREAELKDNGWESAEMDFTMTLKNRSGQETIRKLHSYMLEVENDGDKSLVVFDNPVDVKGTASLVYTHKKGDDDQWLYLPAVKQIKRISSRNKSGPFMGSEFAFEDMASQELEKYTYKFLEETILNGQKTYLVERKPVDRYSGYTRQKVWFNRDNFRIEKIDYYDRRNALVKTLTYSGYKLYNGKFWRPDEMLMINHQTGKETKINYLRHKLDAGLTETDFNLTSLRNAK